ncbi:MAG: MATE family efflux transporter [Lysobacterales bacterium]
MSQENARRDLTKGSVRGHLMRLTWPMTFGILALISTSVVDTYFVASLGTDALSALSFSFPVFMTITGLSVGLGAGATSVVSRSIGKGDQQQISRRCTDALLLSFTLVTTLVILGAIYVRPLFAALGASGEVLDLVVEYVKVLFYGLPFLVIPIVGNSIIRAAGDAKIPGIIMTSTAVLNIILDPILIFGWLGAPRLEMEGAALATVISNAIGMAMALWVLHHREKMIAWNIPKFQEVKESFKKILHVGIPASAANMINPIGIGALTAMLASYGKEAVAAFGVATRIESIAAVGLFALSASIGPIIGQNWGAGKRRRVRLSLTRSFQFCVVYGLACAAILALVASSLPALFSDNPEIIRLARNYLWIVPVTLLGYGINIAAAGALNAAGWPMVSAGLTFLRMFVVSLPIAFLLGPKLGANGIFAALAIANVAAALFSAIAAYKVVNRHAPSQPEAHTQPQPAVTESTNTPSGLS